MAEATKSVLLVDYDSIHRSLSAGDSGAVERLSSRLASWVGAIEAGSLFATRPEAPTRRRVLIRRCYADPAVLGNDRAGFQVVDCPPAEGREHNTAAIHMVLDSIDALDHPTGYEEFILLSSDSDLSPLLIRLRAHNRMTAIYATMETADSYRAIADAIIEEPGFIAALLAETLPAVEEEDKDEARPPADRTEIEALARKVSSATNVPLFAPRTFAELFRHLVEEIAQNGYHFQTTAENVATRMTEAGRKISRRQVVFVVKGLALKGHVFSTGDTPERLADVFREQVLYLAENAGLSLDENERRVMSSWIVGQVPPAGDTQDSAPRKSDLRASGGDEAEVKSEDGQSSRTSRRKPPPKPSGLAKPSEDTKPSEQPKPAAIVSKPSEPSKPPVPQRQDTSASKPTSATSSRSTTATSPSSRERSTGPSAAVTTSGSTASRPTPPVPKPASSPAKSSGDDGDKDTVESSILAAIAQAVDVLVEDSGGKSQPSDRPDDSEPEPAAKAETEADEAPEDDDVPEGDDIGDEIQRIIASYSRNRKDNK